MVVQPAVEFDHLRVIDYQSAATEDLRSVLEDEPGLVFEAHSTDYQTTASLAALVRDHWAILKVGPGLTFALREALFALARIEIDLVDEEKRSHLIDVIEQRMLDNPHYWAPYYEGAPAAQRIARRYSYSDRLRYYWPDPQVAAAEKLLYDNLSAVVIPLPMISQFLPDQYWRVRAGELSTDPHDLVIDKIRDALRPYARACLDNSDMTTDVSKESNFA